MTSFNFTPSSSFVDTTVYKTQQVFVYAPDGVTFIDVLHDAPLLAGFTETISAGISPIRVQLPRSFDYYDQPGAGGSHGTIAQGNVVKYYLFGPGLSTSGLLRYQGFIDTIEPEIHDSGEETVTITLIPFSSVLADHGISFSLGFGINGDSDSYIDPINMIKWFFNNTDSITGKTYMWPLTYDSAGSATSSGNKTSYMFQNQTIQSAFDDILLMLPTNWYYRVNPNNTFTVNAPHTYADHTLYVGKNIVNPQYRQDWSQMRNVVVFQGGTPKGTTSGATTGHTKKGGKITNGGATANVSAAISSGSFSGAGSAVTPAAGQVMHMNVSGGIAGSVGGSINNVNLWGEPDADLDGNTTITSVPMQVLHKAVDSINVFGERMIFVKESRITDLNTLHAVAISLLTQVNRYTIRTKFRVPDQAGQYGMGYPIDSMKVGDTVLVVDPTAPQNVIPTKWDIAIWDVDNWDFKVGVNLNSSLFDHVLPIVSITYGFEYIDIELDSLMPNASKMLWELRQSFQDFTFGQAPSVSGNYGNSTPGGSYGYIQGG